MGNAFAGLLSDAGHAAAFGEVLPQQAVEVLVAAALPGAMGIGEVASDACSVFQCPVAVELGAVVPGDGPEGHAAFGNQFQSGAVDRLGGAVGELGNEGHAGTALHQCEQAVAFVDGADHGIALPMTGFLACLDLGRAGVDHGFALQPASVLGSGGSLASSLAAVAKEASQSVVSVHVAVDAHVADPGNVVVGQPMGDLLRAPLLVLKQAVDGRIHAWIVLPDLARASAPAIGPLLGLARPIGTIGPVTAVAGHLPADRAGCTPHDPCDGAAGLPVAVKDGQGVSFLLGELAVHAGSSLAGVIPASLPAHLSIFGQRGCCTYFVNSRRLTIHSSRRHFVARLNSGVSHYAGIAATDKHWTALIAILRGIT